MERTTTVQEKGIDSSKERILSLSGGRVKHVGNVSRKTVIVLAAVRALFLDVLAWWVARACACVCACAHATLFHE